MGDKAKGSVSIYIFQYQDCRAVTFKLSFSSHCYALKITSSLLCHIRRSSSPATPAGRCYWQLKVIFLTCATVGYRLGCFRCKCFSAVYCSVVLRDLQLGVVEWSVLFLSLFLCHIDRSVQTEFTGIQHSWSVMCG